MHGEERALLVPEASARSRGVAVRLADRRRRPAVTTHESRLVGRARAARAHKQKSGAKHIAAARARALFFAIPFAIPGLYHFCRRNKQLHPPRLHVFQCRSAACRAGRRPREPGHCAGAVPPASGAAVDVAGCGRRRVPQQRDAGGRAITLCVDVGRGGRRAAGAVCARVCGAAARAGAVRAAARRLGLRRARAGSAGAVPPRCPGHARRAALPVAHRAVRVRDRRRADVGPQRPVRRVRRGRRWFLARACWCRHLGGKRRTHGGAHHHYSLPARAATSFSPPATAQRGRLTRLRGQTARHCGR